MSPRAIAAFAGLAGVLLFAAPALAKPCLCEVSVGCPKDKSHKTLVDFGSVASYGELERHKQPRCSDACGDRAYAETASIRAAKDQWCDKLGVGRHEVEAYSRVGRRDTRNNWCDGDQTIGTLVCEMVCECPFDYTYDEDSKLCIGTCGGRAVAAFNLGCAMQSHWE